MLVARPQWQEQASLWRLRTDRRWRELRARVAPGARVLDAGCGLGSWVSFLRRHGYDAIGLDYSEPLLASARERWPGATWLHAPLQEIPLADGSVDAVVSWGVIEHDPAGPRAALAEFRRVLRPGGAVFVTVPIDSPSMRRAAAVEQDAAETNVFFQYLFTPEELDQALRDTGFAIDSHVLASRHIAPVLPRAYAWLGRRSPLVRDAATQLLKPITWATHTSACMLLGIGHKP